MISVLLSLLVLGTVPAISGSGGTACKLKGDLAILLDPAVDAETFQVLKRTAMDASITFDLSTSRVGIWQMTQPPKLELAMGSISQEDLIKKFTEIVQDDTFAQSEGASETLAEAAMTMMQSNGTPMGHQEGSGQGKIILYVAGTRKDRSLMEVAEEVREQEVIIGAIAVGMNEADVEDLFAMTGGDFRVLQLPKYAKDTSARIREFACKKSSGIIAQDSCSYWNGMYICCFFCHLQDLERKLRVESN